MKNTFLAGAAGIVAIVGLVLLASPVTAGHAQEKECALAKSSVEAASRIRGLRIRREIPCLVHDREDVKKYLVHAIETKIPREKLLNDELVGKSLGFIPEDFDYASGIVELYLSQLGGYYDPEKKHFVMAGWLPEMMQPTIAVHELTHALQDQYYDLENFMDDTRMTTDQLLARAALVEGDATAVMLDQQKEQMNQPSVAKSPDVNSFIMQTVIGIGMTAGTEKVPDSLKMMLVFPYASGLRFVHSILQREGYKGIDRVFQKPPRSTEEILHPEKYGIEKPDFIEISDKNLAGHVAGRTVLFSDTLGEFGVSSLLGMFETDRQMASKAAAGWGGDRVVVLSPREEQRVVWMLHWDTGKDAREFFDRYQYGWAKQPEVILEQRGDHFIARTRTRSVEVTVEGAEVTVYVMKR